MGPFATSWLLQVPPSPTNTRSQLLPTSLWDTHIPPGSLDPFQGLRGSIVPSMAGMGGLMGKARLRRWSGEDVWDGVDVLGCRGAHEWSSAVTGVFCRMRTGS